MITYKTHRHIWYFPDLLVWEVLRTGEQTNQIVEVFADLPDDAGEGGPEQLLHIVRPRAVPVVRL